MNKVLIGRSLTLRFMVSMSALIFGAAGTYAQTQLNVLEIPKNGTFEMMEDTLVVNELIMHDSSKIVLNKVSQSSFIKAKKITVASACSIIGNGAAGTAGKIGKEGAFVSGACRSGSFGETGGIGTDGEAGKNFKIETDQLDITSSLIVKLNGGNGGDGGNGGAGSRGSRSTAHCTSNGGDGGNGGNGGNGAKGGNLTLTCHKCDAVVEFTGKINLSNRGGYPGYGGEGGKGGQRGEGASEQSSKRGAVGKSGVNGKKGLDGTPLYYSLVNN